MNDLTPEEIRQTRDDAEREVGLQVATFERVRDGFYTERVVLDTPLEPAVTPLGEHSDLTNVQVIESHVEPLTIPIARYRTEVVWRREGDVFE